jgi:integration host factor subunit alpha
MTKADIARALRQRADDFTTKEAAQFVELLFETMRKTLAGAEKIKVSGFRNFNLRDKRPRNGRNPQTGEATVIAARRVLTFHASPTLRELLNRNTAGSR